MKVAVDGVLAAHGFRPPAWHTTLRELGGLTGSPARLEALAATAGLSAVDVRLVRLDLAAFAVDALVWWRLGMAHTAPWLEALDPAARDQVRDDAVAAVAGLGPPPPLEMLTLHATAPRAGQRTRVMVDS